MKILLASLFVVSLCSIQLAVAADAPKAEAPKAETAELEKSATIFDCDKACATKNKDVNIVSNGTATFDQKTGNLVCGCGAITKQQ
jgi:hypothetical protein